LSRRRVDAARVLLRRYPFARGRWRVASTVIRTDPRGSPALDRVELASLLRDGELLRCRHGLRVAARPDAGYVDAFLFGEYEPAQTRVYRSLVRPGDTVVDVGANFGWYTALFAGAVGEHGRVLAFEPLEHLCVLLRETLALNGSPSQVHVHSCALGSASGSLDVFTFAGLPHGHASSSDLGRDDAIAHTCPLERLDDVLAREGVGHVDFMKIDVEGHERDVLLGAPALLAREDAPIVAFEINRECLHHRGLRARDVESLFRDTGFRHLWRVTTRGLVPQRTPIPDFDSDYVAAKTNRLDRFREAHRP
jgi:FkbM family methyltransferase